MAATSRFSQSTSHVRLVAERSYLWLVVAVVVALLLRVHCLIFPYLWLDEYVTLWSIGGGNYREMLDRALHWTASGPLFVLCYRLSCDLVGDVEWGLKLPGVICGTASVWAAWWVARRLFCRQDVALVAAWLVALGPQFIHFSQEARPYTIGALLLMLALGFQASWVQTGHRGQLAAMAGCSLAAVGFHLLAALALVAQNVFVVLYGLFKRWPWRRWVEWAATQLVVAAGLWFVGIQFRMLSDRHGSMILRTNLPMPTRASLDQSVWGQLQLELTIALAGFAFWWCTRRFPATELAKAWSSHVAAGGLATCSYLVPTFMLTCLCAASVIDGWERYYFLFHTGLMIAVAWVVCAFPKPLSRLLLAAIILGLVSQFNCVGGVPSCRLNGVWFDFSNAQAEVRRRVGPGDLVLSRSGLVEANEVAFLSSPLGASYLKCFCESKDGPLPAEHWPLPFAPESLDTNNYLESLLHERVLDRRDFWLMNVGTVDFDYDEWIRSRLGGQFRKVEAVRYPAICVSHYVRTGDPAQNHVSEKKGTPDSVPATVSKVPCQRSVLD